MLHTYYRIRTAKPRINKIDYYILSSYTTINYPTLTHLKFYNNVTKENNLLFPKTFSGNGPHELQPNRKKNYLNMEKNPQFRVQGKEILQKIFFLSFGIISFYAGNQRCWSSSLKTQSYTAFFHRTAHYRKQHWWRKWTYIESESKTRVHFLKIQAHISNCKNTFNICQAKTNVTAVLWQEQHSTLPSILTMTKLTRVE